MLRRTPDNIFSCVNFYCNPQLFASILQVLIPSDDDEGRRVKPNSDDDHNRGFGRNRHGSMLCSSKALTSRFSIPHICR